MENTKRRGMPRSRFVRHPVRRDPRDSQHLSARDLSDLDRRSDSGGVPFYNTIQYNAIVAGAGTGIIVTAILIHLWGH